MTIQTICDDKVLCSFCEHSLHDKNRCTCNLQLEKMTGCVSLLVRLRKSGVKTAVRLSRIDGLEELRLRVDGWMLRDKWDAKTDCTLAMLVNPEPESPDTSDVSD